MLREVDQLACGHTAIKGRTRSQIFSFNPGFLHWGFLNLTCPHPTQRKEFFPSWLSQTPAALCAHRLSLGTVLGAWALFLSLPSSHGHGGVQRGQALVCFIGTSLGLCARPSQEALLDELLSEGEVEEVRSPGICI